MKFTGLRDSRIPVLDDGCKDFAVEKQVRQKPGPKAKAVAPTEKLLHLKNDPDEITDVTGKNEDNAKKLDVQ